MWCEIVVVVQESERYICICECGGPFNWDRVSCDVAGSLGGGSGVIIVVLQ